MIFGPFIIRSSSEVDDKMFLGIKFEKLLCVLTLFHQGFNRRQ